MSTIWSIGWVVIHAVTVSPRTCRSANRVAENSFTPSKPFGLGDPTSCQWGRASNGHRLLLTRGFYRPGSDTSTASQWFPVSVTDGA